MPELRDELPVDHDDLLISHFGLCPRCGSEPIRRDIEKANFLCCDDCRVYWSAGWNIMTPLQQNVREGDLDEEIGGAANREDFIAKVHAKHWALLDTYEPSSPIHFKGERESVQAGLKAT